MLHHCHSILSLSKCEKCIYIFIFRPTKYEGQSRVVIQHVEYSRFRENLEFCQLFELLWLDHTLVEGVTLLSTWSLTPMELAPNVPGRLEDLYHLQVSSVIILPGDKLKTKLPHIHVNFS